MRLVVLALLLMAGSPLRPASATTPDFSKVTQRDVLGSLLDYKPSQGPLAPTATGQYVAQDISNKMFSALVGLLGGQAPTLNVVDSIPYDGFHAQAYRGQNKYDIDAEMLNALLFSRSPGHSGAVNGLIHEMSHLRQLQQVLADTPLREGGAQAFADMETPMAAQAARQPYVNGNYDGAYTQYVKDVLATKGQQWVTAGQFGH